MPFPFLVVASPESKRFAFQSDIESDAHHPSMGSPSRTRIESSQVSFFVNPKGRQAGVQSRSHSVRLKARVGEYREVTGRSKSEFGPGETRGYRRRDKAVIEHHTRSNRRNSPRTANKTNAGATDYGRRTRCRPAWAASSHITLSGGRETTPSWRAWWTEGETSNGPMFASSSRSSQEDRNRHWVK